MQDIIIGCDHRGFALKQKIKDFLREKKLFVIDVGVSSAEPAKDSEPVPPIINVVKEVAEVVISSKHFCGILICSDGVAMTIASNRFKGIRATIARSPEGIRYAREHNDINVLCIGADYQNPADNLDFEVIKKIINAYTSTKPLDVPRYKKRQELFDKIG